MKLEGIIKRINDEQIVTASFKKREFVITTQEQYPQDILIEVTQDKTSLIDKFKAGDSVSVDINIRGREWINPEGVAKYFNTLQAWAIWTLGSQPQSNGSAPQIPNVKSPTPSPSVDTFYNGDDDDLPF